MASSSKMASSPKSARAKAPMTPFERARLEGMHDEAWLADDAKPVTRADNGDLSGELIGDAASLASLDKLNRLMAEIKEQEVLGLLREALIAFKRGEWKEGGDLALKVLHINERHAEAWHMLAISRDKCGDFTNSLNCYEKALIMMPDNLNIANDLGRLAHRNNMHDMAAKFFEYVLARDPKDYEAVNNLASTLREMNDLDGAQELLKSVLTVDPNHAVLWNTLGTVVNARGDLPTALIFYDEALRHDEKFTHAIYNRANIKSQLGDFESAIKDADYAARRFTDPIPKANADLAAAHMTLASGKLAEGWQRYLNRSVDGTASKITAVVNRPRWEPGDEVTGKHLFVCGEQGLGDEVMFGTALTDLVQELGPEGRLTLGVEPRLVPMFQKAFPDATVYGHRTVSHAGQVYRFFPGLPADHDIDAWMFMGQLMGRYRSDIRQFPINGHLFRPDPARVAYWQGELAKLGPLPKVGLLWKSLIKHSARDRYYSPFEQWSDILGLEGLTFINLQYGDVSEELKAAEEAGIHIYNPPGIDLKEDLDDLSALCQAVDIVLGPSNATSNIAAASGTPVWLLTPRGAWTALGQAQDYPWYPKARMFTAHSLLDWTPTMNEMRQALIEEWVGKPSVSR